MENRRRIKSWAIIVFLIGLLVLLYAIIIVSRTERPFIDSMTAVAGVLGFSLMFFGILAMVGQYTGLGFD